VILFPIAFIWIVVLLVYLIKNSTNDSDAGGDDSPPRRFRPRRPHDSRDRGPRDGSEGLRRRRRPRDRSRT
jgi:hypothetical protein